MLGSRCTNKSKGKCKATRLYLQDFANIEFFIGLVGHIGDPIFVRRMDAVLCKGDVSLGVIDGGTCETG